MRRRGAPEIQKPKDTGNVLRRLIPYFAEYKVRLAVIAVLLVMGTLMDLAAPYLIGVAVDQFIAVPDAPMPGWLSWLLGPDASRTTGLTTVMIVLTVTYATVWGLNVAQFRLMVRVSQRVLLVMRTQILDQLHRLSLDFFDDAQAGDLMSRLTNDTQVINDMFGPGLMRLLRMSLTLVGIVVAMLGLNWRLSAMRCWRFTRADRIAALLCGTQKTVAMGIPLILVIYDHGQRTGLISIPLLCYHPLQLLMGTAMAAKFGTTRQQEEA